MTEADDFYPSYIVLCVFNAFFSFTAIMLNILTILALIKTSSMPKPLRTLLLSLAVSDLGVGLLVQPLYIAWVVMIKEQNTKTQTFVNTLYAYMATMNFFCFASFFGVVALSADRFLAVHLHLRYQELVTHKRVVAVVISIWVFSAFLLLVWFKWTSSSNVMTIIGGGTIQGVCYITTALFYCRIYLAIRHHSNQIHVLQVQLAQNGEVIANAARQRKSAVATFYVYLVFLACYVPNLCIWVVHVSTGLSSVGWHWKLYTRTLVLLNSSLNPLIYSWKMRHIRHAIMDILRNVFPSHN